MEINNIASSYLKCMRPLKNGIIDVIKSFSSLYISKESNNYFLSTDIQEKIKNSDAIIINEYIDEGRNNYFFYICIKNFLIIINQSLITFFSDLFNVNPYLSIYFLSENTKTNFNKMLKISEIRIKKNDDFLTEIHNFQQSFVFLGLSNSQNNKINKSARCILGYLIREGYSKIDQKQAEISNRIKNLKYFTFEDNIPNNISEEIFDENDYIELRNIGNGSLFTVVLIYHIPKRELFVIKKTNGDYRQISKLIKREQFNYSKLNHPFLPKFYGKTNKNNYSIIQFINGKTLDDINSMNLSFNEKITIIFELMIIINYLYKNDFVYRDLKPNNVMIDINKTIFLIDFDRMIKISNITKNDNFTADFSSVFMAPEVCEGKTTHKSDIYSIGQMIYFIINEKFPEYNNGSNLIQNLDLQYIYKRCTSDDSSERPFISELMFQFFTMFNSNIDESIIHCFYDVSDQNDPQEQYNFGAIYYNGELIKKDITKSINLWSLAANQNFPEAEFIIGKFYYEGTHISKDMKKAVYYLTKAADHNHTDAQLILGLIYLEGRNIKRDINKAIQYLSDAANKSIEQAQFILGITYYDGKLIERNINKAIHFLSLASNQNNSKAQYYLGKIYLDNKYIRQDISKAIHFLTLAADKNHPNAQLILGTLYSENNYIPRDINKAIHYLSQAAVQNNQYAQFNLGSIYYEGKYIKIDISKAIHYFSLAADQNNNSQAQFNLGNIYSEGKYIKPDINKAIHYFTLASNQNHPKAQTNLGLIYFYGRYITQDINKAIHYLSLAADKNNLDAQFVLGRIFYNGQYIKRDINKAFHYFSLAANQNDPRAQLNLGIIYLEGEYIKRDINKSIYYLTNSANQNNLSAQYFLGTIYYEGKYITRDINKAIYYLSFSANQNNINSQFYLGTIFYEGKYIARDINKSIFYLSLAADRNNSSAQFYLGFTYYEGKYITQDINKSIHYFTIAAIQNDPDAQFYLGSIYLEGKYITQNINKGIYYYSLAANHNHSKAQFNLGNFYIFGLFVDKKVIKGIDLLILSSSNGSIDACFSVGFFYHEGIYVSRDINKLLHYYKEASSFNNQYAKNNLGIIYKNGIGNEIPRNVAFAMTYFNEAIQQSNDSVSMYNLAHIYIFDDQSNERIEQSIQLLIKSLNNHFHKSIPLLCIALIKKHNFDIEKIKDELHEKTEINKDIKSKIIRKIKIDKLNIKFVFDEIYQSYKTIDYMYDFTQRVIPSKNLNEQFLPQSYNNTKYNITNEFYEGFSYNESISYSMNI